MFITLFLCEVLFPLNPNFLFCTCLASRESNVAHVLFACLFVLYLFLCSRYISLAFYYYFFVCVTSFPLSVVFMCNMFNRSYRFCIWISSMPCVHAKTMCFSFVLTYLNSLCFCICFACLPWNILIFTSQMY